MKCPVCSYPLRTVNTKSAAVDVCPNCGGIWFDDGELSPFVNRLSLSQQISPEKVQLFQKRNIKLVFSKQEKEKICPHCGRSMQKFNYAYDSNICLNKCSDCGGIWADGGETKAIASYLKADPDAAEVGRELAEAFFTGDNLQIEEDIKNAAEKTKEFILFFPRVILPFGSDRVLKKFPVVTLLLIIFSVLAFTSIIIADPAILSGTIEPMIDNDFQSTDLITSIFLIGSPLNLLWSALFLWIFSGSIEDHFGRINFLIFFLAVAGFSIFPYVLFHCDLHVLAVALAGGVSGVIGAHLIFFPMSKIKTFIIFRIFEIPAVILIGAWFVLLLISPFLSFASSVPKSAWFAPIIGFVGSLAVCHYVKTSTGVDKYPF